MIPRRTLGQSPEMMPVITLGGNIFGALLNEVESLELINSALGYGIHAIDTADIYSEGLSEEIIGKAISGRRQKFFIATKAGIRSHEKPFGLARKGTIKRKAELSLRRLKTDFIDLYQIHHFDPTTPPAEMLEAFSELVSEGKIRYAGFSNFSRERLSQVLSAPSPLFVSNQIKYNILKPEWLEDVTKISTACGVTFLTYGVLGRGILTGKYSEGNVPPKSRAEFSSSVRADLTPEVLEKVNLVRNFGIEQGSNLLETVLQLTLGQKNITSMVIGIRTQEQLTDLAMAALRPPLPDAEVDRCMDCLKSLAPLPSSSFGADVYY